MTEEQKCRAEFEKWYYGLDVQPTNSMINMWWAWQAAWNRRASIDAAIKGEK